MIDYGKKVMMFTLRECYVETRWTKGECGEPVAYQVNCADYLTNLAVTPERAIEKARKIAASLGLSLNVSATEMTLDQIERRNSAEEIANAKAEREAYAAMQLKEETLRKAAELVLITEGCFLFGKYVGKTITEVFATDPNYVTWAYSNADAMHVKMIDAAGVIQAYNETPIGQDGDVVELELTLKDMITNVGVYNTNLFKFVTANNQLVTLYSTAKKFVALEEGSSIKVSATVARISGYNGEFSTTIKRPKMI